jgi:hypothetical protein
MKLRSGLVFVGLLSLGLLNYSCANGDTVTGVSSGAGGTHTGGTTGGGTGGTHTGGTTGTGTGGTHTGGSTGSGTGGIVTSTGGITGTGGIVTSTGGITGTGGIVTTGTGGTTTVTCSPTFQPTTGGWVTAPAAGGTCWHGYAYNFADALGTTTVTPGTAMTYATCSTTCPLTAMGSVAIASAANSYATYAGIGFNINQDLAGGTATPTLTPAGSSLTIAFTAGSGTPLRAQISDGTTIWCYGITGASPVTIPYASFNTKCYDTPADGTAYAKNPISSFQLQVPGGAAAVTYNIALTSVKENN